MANAAPPFGPQGAVSDGVARFLERSGEVTQTGSILTSVAVAVEQPAAPLISLSDVTPSTADILLITLKSDYEPSDDSITQLDTSQNLVVTSIANEDFAQNTTALLLSPTDSVSLSSSDDTFLAPAPKPTVSRLSELRNVRHVQKTYAKPPLSTQLILNPDDIPVSQIAPVTHVKPNDNSILKALISRPCMEIPTSNIMRSIQIPIIRPVSKQSTLRNPTRRAAKSSARTTPVRASTSAHTSHEVPVSLTTLNTETLTSFAVTPTMSLFPDSAPVSPYVTTASLITIPLTTLSYATTKAYPPSALVTHKTRISTPTLVPLATSTVSSLATSKSTVAAVMRSLSTATATSLTTTITNTNVKLIPTANCMTTVTRDIDSHMRVTYATKVRNPPSVAVQSPAGTAVVTGTTTTATVTPITMTTTVSSRIPSSDTQFLEPLPVTKSRTGARTFSGPRKTTVNPRSSGNVSQRVVIRQANPRSIVDKMVKNPAPLHKIADAAVTRLHHVSQIIHKDAPHSGPLPTPTSTISFATTSSGTTHTLIVPHYKDTVFKNLSSIAYADPARLGSPRCPTERIVIRRPVAYFSPRRSFSCVGSSAQSSSAGPTAQRTIIRAVPVSLSNNPQHVLRTVNLPQSVLATATVPDNILAVTTSMLTLATPNNVNTTKI